jgi:hypothetical protein
MNITSKMIGTELRRIFAALRRPMGWSVIDAFPHLEEREERPSLTRSGSNTTTTRLNRRVEMIRTDLAVTMV